MKSYTVKELAAMVGGKTKGDADLTITGAAPVETAGRQDISFISNNKYKSYLKDSQAGAIVVDPELAQVEKTLIIIENPYYAFARILTQMTATERVSKGIMPGATIGEDAILSEDISIYPGAYLGNNVEIGARTDIYPGVSLGDGVKIGSDCKIYPNVSIYHECRLGNNVIVHSGAIIGSDGFGFAPYGEKYYKFPQVGRVEIGYDVEIGAGTTIDRAALGVTSIGSGTKIDNLVQIGHNVEIGENSIIVSHVGISGSTKLGRHVIIGGQVGLAGHIKVGDFAMVAAKSGVNKDIPAGEIYGGIPATNRNSWLRVSSALKYLPRMLTDIRELKARIKALEEK